jgi:hypothetical protein
VTSEHAGGAVGGTQLGETPAATGEASSKPKESAAASTSDEHAVIADRDDGSVGDAASDTGSSPVLEPHVGVYRYTVTEAKSSLPQLSKDQSTSMTVVESGDHTYALQPEGREGGATTLRFAGDVVLLVRRGTVKTVGEAPYFSNTLDSWDYFVTSDDGHSTGTAHATKGRLMRYRIGGVERSCTIVRHVVVLTTDSKKFTVTNEDCFSLELGVPLAGRFSSESKNGSFEYSVELLVPAA